MVRDRGMLTQLCCTGEYFPGTGHLNDTGVGPGKNYSINVPLRDGIDDDNYHRVFKPV